MLCSKQTEFKTGENIKLYKKEILRSLASGIIRSGHTKHIYVSFFKFRLNKKYLNRVIKPPFIVVPKPTKPHSLMEG